MKKVENGMYLWYNVSKLILGGAIYVYKRNFRSISLFGNDRNCDCISFCHHMEYEQIFTKKVRNA